MGGEPCLGCKTLSGEWNLVWGRITLSSGGKPCVGEENLCMGEENLCMGEENLFWGSKTLFGGTLPGGGEPGLWEENLVWGVKPCLGSGTLSGGE